jgi:hypothetical protein
MENLQLQLTDSVSVELPLWDADQAALESIAPEHYHLVSQSARRRKLQTQKRLAWLKERWNDEAYFEAVVASGRYLKFCTMIEWASDNDDRASRRIDEEASQAQ